MRILKHQKNKLMDQSCDICRAAIPEGTFYGSFVFSIEKMENDVVTVVDAKNITVLCIQCASQFNGFEEAKALLD